jgi:hypothetical protein
VRGTNLKPGMLDGSCSLNLGFEATASRLRNQELIGSAVLTDFGSSPKFSSIIEKRRLANV